MNRWLTSVLSLTLLLLNLPLVLAQESDWPRTLPLDEGLVTIYAPQLDSMTENTIHYRAALAYRESPGAEPVFGAGWFESPVEIDKANRVVHPKGFKLTETRFPAGTGDIKSALSASLASQAPDWNLDFSLDELETALKTAEAETNAVEKLNTKPPEIIYRDHPAILITMDGQPVLREIEKSPYQAVINTPYPLIFDNKHFYLNAAKDVWYSADKATGPYRFEANPPADVASMVKDKESEVATEVANETITAANAPEIVISTEPAELIVTEGPAAFVPLVDELLVLQNSENDVFMDLNSQEYYIVLSGRWYHASSLSGPWSYQLADNLPTAFANIPQQSDQADSRVYVAGTPEAREAVLDSQVPQTAAVKRGEADIKVEYDGEPVYEPVDGTELVYIRNTGSTVLKSGGLFYLVENGVWYVATNANGPWQVSDHRPEQVDTILPTSPVYNSKYVHVYDSTPNVVYVGYTPGYTGSYVYHNTLFYGTGWYYRPWVSPYYYYPRHRTWGFNVAYNMWGGWNFGLSWAWGPFSVGYYSGGYWHHNHYWHHRNYGHWGPRGYRPRPGHHRRNGKRYAQNSHGRNDYGRNEQRGRDGGNRQDGRRSETAERNENLYSDTSQRATVANTRDRQAGDSERRYDSTRQANNSTAKGMRQKNYDGVKKGERNRTGPVSTSDLRKKAVVRDINSIEANRGNLLADNNGDIYRGSGRKAAGNEPVSRRQIAAKSPENRSRSAANNRKQNPSQNTRRTSSRASSKGETKQSTQPVYGYSSGKTKDSPTNRQNRQRVNSTASSTTRQPNTVNRSASGSNKRKQSQARTFPTPSQKQNVTRSNSRLKSSKSSVRTQPQPSRNTVQSQRSQPTSRSQNTVRNQSAPVQSSQNRGRNKPAASQNTAKRSSGNSGSKSKRSVNGPSKRTGGSRSKG